MLGVGASGAHKGAEETRVFRPVVPLLPRGQLVVLLGAEGRDGRHDGLVVLDGQDDDGVASGLGGQVAARDEVVIVLFVEGLRGAEEGDIAHCPCLCGSGRGPSGAVFVRHVV